LQHIYAEMEEILKGSQTFKHHVLDLHENNLTSLPEDIGQLKALQVLNAEKNQIKALPETIGDLHLLQTLNVKGNHLSKLPSSLGRLCSLRTLDISENQVKELPLAMANIRTLECLTLDATQMTFPPASVCAGGTEVIQRFLCSELGVEYCPPSQYLLPVLERDGGPVEADCVDGEQEAWQNKFLDYAKRKEQKQQEKLEFERRLDEEQREHTQLFLLNHSRKEDILQSVKQEQERLEQGVMQQQKVMELERQRLLDQMKLTEMSISSRISHLLLENKRCVLSAMQKMLSESYSLRLLQEASETRRNNLVTETCRSLESLDKKFDQVLSLQQLDKSKAIAQILQERECLRNLVQRMPLQRALIFKPSNLPLWQGEMEQKSDSNLQNYWMIQYQRLLDAKPLSLRMQEAGVEKELVSLLCKLSAQHYLPVVAHHRVTAESLRHMTQSDLSKVLTHLLTFVNTYMFICAFTILLAPCVPTSPPYSPVLGVVPSAPSLEERPGSSECVVCMEKESQVIFLPCGHVCCCQVCSDALQTCPLCRSHISQRVRIYHP
uniref:Leucine rich repeat and sterile alpha motif containing 1 n=1 Tax=Scleropages formosus TaxID=113540 RepID=A0A8C9VV32_SCLFO